MTHPAPDPLREAAEYILDGMGIDGPDYTVDPDDDFLEAANSKWVRDMLTRLATALAAAEQPGPASADERADLSKTLYNLTYRLSLNDADRIADALLAAGWTRSGAEAGLREDYEQAVIQAAAWKQVARRMEAERDAALARPSAPETLAWAVEVDGEIVWIDADAPADNARRVAEHEGGKAVRVAIRKLEGEA